MEASFAITKPFQRKMKEMYKKMFKKELMRLYSGIIIAQSQSFNKDEIKL